jgi:succinyl-diaminopimelate desuccinylase
MDTSHDALLRRIEDRRDEVVALTQELIRIPTVNPPGDAYEACARHLGERLARAGMQVEYIRARGAPGDSDAFPRTSVVARVEGSTPGECVHFNGHIDVVEPGPGWTVDPFAALVREGRVYGRGACDMKGGIASAVIAVESILQSGIPFAGALEISSAPWTRSPVAMRVSGIWHRWGILQPLGIQQPRVHHVVIPEPLGVDRICLGHRGVWWGEVETRGRIAHGSMPFLGGQRHPAHGARSCTNCRPR